MSTDNKRTGGISVETRHIFPIIKKWLYSDKDIFVREIVSNACDAVTKLRRLDSLGEISLSEESFAVNVCLDREAGTLTVTDNGIGMTEEELQKYICSIALSGALDFIQKYEQGDASTGIIGHFGLGFYSAFMVSDTVEIFTRSYTGAPAVHWTCNEEGEYTVEPSDKEERGTEIVMHISDEEKDYLDPSKLREIIGKYCSFMPVEIYFDDGEEKADEEAEEPSAPINDTTPLWSRSPSDITPEQYNEFYHKLFADPNDPLFSIHIKADYPLNFKGILFFPKIANEYQSLEAQIKLYYNQVFVADNIKEVLPEYLFMLRGALDCPELPLNVSRSYLQDNAYVKKLSAHIVKKVADKLCSMCQNEREEYEKVYSGIRIFIEYAALRDRKFYDRVKNSILLKLTDGTSKTVDAYLEDAKEKHEGKVYYTTDTAREAQYISMFTAEGIDVALLDLMIDSQFISALESYRDDVKFIRVDAGAADILKSGEATEELGEDMVSLFREVSGSDKLTVKAEHLKDASVPAILAASEESRRFEEMMKMYAGASGELSFPVEYTLSLNTASPITSALTGLMATDAERAKCVASYIYKLSLMAQKKLTGDELRAFLEESYRILEMIL